MNLKGNSYILIALLVGTVGVFALHRAMSGRTQIAKEPCQQVVVADADISSGTALNARLLKTVDWPQRLCPGQTAMDAKQVDGRVSLVSFSKGEPVLFNKLAPEGTAAGLGGLLNKDMRAFTVKVDDVSGVAGFIFPGDRVDVLMTITMLENNGEQLSKIILQDLKVLTAGPTWEQSANNKGPTSVNTVTLEVSPEQSEVLNLASTQGKIRLVLRSRANKDIKYTEGVATSHLINGQANNKVAASPVMAERPKTTVEVIKGMDRSSTTFEGGDREPARTRKAAGRLALK